MNAKQLEELAARRETNLRASRRRKAAGVIHAAKHRKKRVKPKPAAIDRWLMALPEKDKLALRQAYNKAKKRKTKTHP
jgi:hypothetical protein